MPARPIKVIVDLLNRRPAGTINYNQNNSSFPEKTEGAKIIPI